MKNGKIELLRFLMSAAVVFFHGLHFAGDSALVPGGWYAVEFFLVVSGYLMAKSINKEKQYCADSSLFNHTVCFTKKKLSAFLPEFVFSWIIAFSFCVIVDRLNFSNIILAFKNSVSELLLFKMVFPNSYGVNGVTWYLSSMMIFTIIIYPLARYKDGIIAKVLLPVIIIFSGSYLGSTGSLRGTTEWIDFIYKGTLRTFFGMSLGMIAFYLFENLKEKKLTIAGKVLMEIFEIAVYAATIAAMISVGQSKNYSILTVLLTCAVAFTFSGHGLLNRFFNNRLFYFLGKLSLPMYLCNIFFCGKMNKLVPEDTPYLQKYLYLWIMVFATSFIVMGLSKLWRKKKTAVVSLFVK